MVVFGCGFLGWFGLSYLDVGWSWFVFVLLLVLWRPVSYVSFGFLLACLVLVFPVAWCYMVLMVWLLVGLVWLLVLLVALNNWLMLFYCFWGCWSGLMGFMVFGWCSGLIWFQHCWGLCWSWVFFLLLVLLVSGLLLVYWLDLVSVWASCVVMSFSK